MIKQQFKRKNYIIYDRIAYFCKIWLGDNTNTVCVISYWKMLQLTVCMLSHKHTRGRVSLFTLKKIIVSFITRNIDRSSLILRLHFKRTYVNSLILRLHKQGERRNTLIRSIRRNIIIKNCTKCEHCGSSLVILRLH